MDSGLDGGGIVRDFRKAYMEKYGTGSVNIVSVDWGKHVTRVQDSYYGTEKLSCP